MEKISINIVQSSSKGNCIILYDGKTYLILDFGVNDLIWNNSLSSLNIDVKNISGILITHYHIDHIKTIEKSTTDNMLFFLSEKTYEFILNKYNKKINAKILNSYIGKYVKVNNSNWNIKPYWTIHNAEESLCFVIKNKKKEIVYLTDTKFFINKKLKNKTAYIMESPFGLEYDLKNKNKIFINLEKEQNHLKLHETERLLNIYSGKKTKLFLFSHLNPSVSDFSIIENIIKKYSTSKMDVKYLKPNEILKRKFEI